MDNLIIVDKKGDIVATIPEAICTECIVGRKCSSGKVVASSADEVYNYYICFDKLRNRKQAKFIMKHFGSIASVIRKNEIREAELIASATDIVVHDTKTLLAQLNAKYDKYRYDSYQKDLSGKKESINKKIDSDRKSFVTDFFNIGKLITQLQNEYSVIDLLQVKEVFAENKRIGYEIHKLLMETYYHYEEEFSILGIVLDFEGRKDIHYKVDIEYRSIKTALSQFLDNVIKYAMPKEKIFIDFEDEGNILRMRFHMKSLYLTDADIPNIKQPGIRGEYAIANNIPGQGYGMFIINHLLSLNNGSLITKRTRDIKIQVPDDPRTFSHNLFEITLPLHI